MATNFLKNPASREQLIKLKIEDFFVISNGRENVLVFTVRMPFTLLPKAQILMLIQAQ
jgi:hypothetical protein